jgi:predicted dehydrogenase
VRCMLARHARTEPEFLWATAVHAVDTLRYVAGAVAAFEINTMRATGDSTPWYAIDFRFENGISGRIDVMPTTGMVEETYDLFADGFRASVTCPFGPQRGWRGYRDGRLITDELADGSEPEDVLNGCYDEAAEFIRALRSNSAPKPSIAEVAPSVTLCMAMVKAANVSPRT